VQASTCYGHDNSYVADAIAAHPERFTGVFSADVLAPDAVATMRHWILRKFTGMRLFTTGSTMPGQMGWLDDGRSFPAWDYASETGISVCLQMTAKAIPQVETLLKRFPRVRVILDHFARPVLDDGPPYQKASSLWSLARYENIFLKATPHTFLAARQGMATPASFFRQAVETFGAARIAWGSNFPAAEGSLSALLGAARENFSSLSPVEHEQISSRTALMLYPALADR
jgi:predicted TIM-barrel fold metal-dependent hydrolase